MGDDAIIGVTGIDGACIIIAKVDWGVFAFCIKATTIVGAGVVVIACACWCRVVRGIRTSRGGITAIVGTWVIVIAKPLVQV